MESKYMKRKRDSNWKKIYSRNPNGSILRNGDNWEIYCDRGHVFFAIAHVQLHFTSSVLMTIYCCKKIDGRRILRPKLTINSSLCFVKYFRYVRFEVFTAVTMASYAVWLSKGINIPINVNLLQHFNKHNIWSLGPWVVMIKWHKLIMIKKSYPI
jgi:hypothetical protein